LKPIELVIVFEASPQRVWAELADLASHPEWMSDAGAIEFLGEQRSGVGTRMRVPTRIGPLQTDDVMTVIEWDEGSVIAVEHVGAVSGVGRFEIAPFGDGTEMRWREELRFPWWLGGPVGVAVAGPIMRRIWRGNLERLRDRLDLTGP
jgi:uncharacterized protein YndB with AHSA1/START domain